MRTIALSVLGVNLLLAASLLAADVDTPYVRIAKTATYISAGDTVGALEAFDKSLTNYGKIAEDLTALSAQADVLCAIEVVSDKEADDAKADIHHLDLDWYMTLTSRADTGLTEKRRVRVAVTIQRFNAKWRITALSPDSILAPITIK
jgi:hypothetical protein